MRPSAPANSSLEATTAQREALTMALYACVVLAAEFVGMGDHLDSTSFAISVIWGTTVGLTLAHVFAFDLAARMFSEGALARDTQVAIAFQLAAGAAVAAVLTVPFLFLQPSLALDVAGYLTAGFVGLTAYGVARTAGRSSLGAVTFGVVSLVIAAVVVGVKAALSHH
jgi:hypothetical protein